MSNEDEDKITLRRFIDVKFDDLEKRLELRDEMTERALLKADENLGIRLHGMNEFRSQLTQQAATFVNRIEFDTKYQMLLDKIDIITKLLYTGAGILLVLELVIKFFY